MLSQAPEPVSNTENNLPNLSEKATNDKNSNLADTPTVNSTFARQEPILPQVNNDHQNVRNSIAKWVINEKRRKFESDPYPQTSYLRKYYSGKDKNLPKELKELFTPLKCNLCHCSMGSAVTAKDHYEGKKHVSNIKKWLGEHPKYINQYHSDTNLQKISEFGGLYCKNCDVILSSQQQAQLHHTGNKQKCVVNYVGNLNTLTSQWERSTAIDMESRFGFANKEAAANQKFFCDTCQVACPSQITFNDHLSGAKHKKRVMLLFDSEPPPATKDNILEDVIRTGKKPTSPADLSIYRTPSGKYYCHSCNITVNSPIQFLQHSDSRKHKHKSSNKMFK